jgi:hypothetical protein
MIHAKELRFGNKVQTQHDEIITVQQILCNSLIYDTQIKVSREFALAGSARQPAYATPFIELVKEIDYQEIEPILLTPKILEKCGFRQFVREDWILSISNSHYDFEFTAEGLRLRHPTPSRVSIKYLHQLQNFLYALTGFELEADL